MKVPLWGRREGNSSWYYWPPLLAPHLFESDLLMKTNLKQTRKQQLRAQGHKPTDAETERCFFQMVLHVRRKVQGDGFESSDSLGGTADKQALLKSIVELGQRPDQTTDVRLLTVRLRWYWTVIWTWCTSSFTMIAQVTIMSLSAAFWLRLSIAAATVKSKITCFQRSIKGHPLF